MEDEKIADLLFEIGRLKTTPRTGWLKAGIRLPESIADHSMRTAMIGWLIAEIEGADSGKVVKMCLLHDIGETRIGDFDRVMKKYIDKRGAELKAQLDIAKRMPEKMKDEVESMYTQLSRLNTKEAEIVKDADRLEMYIQAHEYEYFGSNKELMKVFKVAAGKSLKTKTAKQILKAVERGSPKDWWQFAEGD